jgi:hypothetical protein
MSAALGRVWLVGWLLAFAGEAQADVIWWGQGSLGSAFSLHTRLTILQEGEADLRLHARYATDAFERPLYYALRVTRWNDAQGWALELRHHKLDLENPPPEVQQFSGSHGYNLLTVCRLWRRERLDLGAGAGLVIAHPETVVRGRTVGLGHRLP